MTMLCCPWRHFKWENIFQQFPNQSQEGMPRQFWKLISCLFMETYITNSFCGNVPQKIHPSLYCELLFPISSIYLLFHMVFITTHSTIIYNYTYTNSFFILCSEFHTACMQTIFCQSCLHHIKGSTGLVYDKTETQTSWIFHCPWQAWM
jgi:hypothetical protein